MSRLPRHSTIAAYLALFVALGGTSYAVIDLPRNSVGAGELRKNAVRSADVKNRSLKQVDFAKGSLPIGAPGTAGARGPAGPAGPAGAPGTARAYVRVSPGLCGAAPTGTCVLDNNKGVTQVTHRATGVYCVVAPGIDSNQSTAAVTLDSATSVAPRAGAAVLLLGDSGICPAGAFAVETRDAVDTFTDSVAFSIVIP
jgi:hypothetical protein